MRRVLEQIEASAVLVLVTLALASYRASRLIVLDDVLGRWRTEPDDETGEPGQDATGLRRLADVALYRDDGEARSFVARWLGDMLRCQTCAGVWTTIAIVVAWFCGPDWLQWGVLGTSVAGGQAFLSTRAGA